MPSAIEWTSETLNPTVGCTRVSAGCDHCYAYTLHDRRHAAWKAGTFPNAPSQYHRPFSVVQLRPERLDQPFRWRTPKLIFVDSVSDLFHPDVPGDLIDKLLAVAAATPHHTYQILTKRPQRMARFMSSPDRLAGIRFEAGRVSEMFERSVLCPDSLPLPNVWLGTSIENDDAAWRADFLRKTPAAVRFVSAEPLIGPLDALDLTGIDWLIAGGESGPGCRPCDPAWARLIRDRCAAAGVAFFWKQWGGRTSKAGGRELDGRTWDEMPKVAS